MPFGMERDAMRNVVLMQDTGPIPLNLLAPAMMLARQVHTGNFPPTSGQVIEQAVLIQQRSDPDRYLNPVGGSTLKPQWYRQMQRHRMPRRRVSE